MTVELEKYRGTKSRHTCPACNSKGVFVRYQDERGEYLSNDVGRCNRESKCGYHYKPKQFYADNPKSEYKQPGKAKKKGLSNYGFADKNGLQAKQEAAISPKKPDYIESKYLLDTLTSYERNAFVKFLFDLFPDCSEEIQNVLKMYFVGTYEDYTCFPSIDRLNRVCRAKLIRFNRGSGKRLKGDYDTSSLPAKLKLKDFQYKQIFFGEHLLPKYPDKPVAIVEAEKTAIIASLCFPEFVWLGSNSKTWLKTERLKRLGQRQIILYPDADGFELWQSIAREGQRQRLTIEVLNLIESRATIEQKANGYDLADYLINQSREINAHNQFVNSYNAKLEAVLSDEFVSDISENDLKDFAFEIDEREAIMSESGDGNSILIRNEAIKDVTRKWFGEIL